MKEIDLAGAILLEYDNDEIYKNQRTIRFWSMISLIMAIITAVSYIISNTMQNTWRFEYTVYLFFFMCLIFQPLMHVLEYRKAGIRPRELSISEITKIRNSVNPNKQRLTHFPFAMTICKFLLYEFIKILAIFIVGLSDISNYWAYVGIWAGHLGYMLASTFFTYIALIYLVKNCILMKKEWEANPPRIVLESLEEEQKEKNIKFEQNNYKQYKLLIEKSGIKFFIKYYKQIKRLPLRDVNVTENYSPSEREERLLAAKKIIDLNLVEFTLTEVIKSYSDILDETDLTQAKSFLAELQPVNRKKVTTNNQTIQQIQKPMSSMQNGTCDDFDD